MGTRGPKTNARQSSGLLFEAGRPACPSYLNAEASEIFEAACDRLADAGVLQLVDGAIIEAYSVSLAQYRKLSQELDTEGVTVEGPRGGVMRNPKDQSRGAAHAQMVQAAGKLGFSPTDRERLSRPEKPKEKNALDRYMEGRGS